jgi:hypothetical protein
VTSHLILFPRRSQSCPLARPKAATAVPYALLSDNNRIMTSDMVGLTTPTATPGNAHAHGNRPNFTNSRRWTPSVAIACRNISLSMPTVAVSTIGLLFLMAWSSSSETRRRRRLDVWPSLGTFSPCGLFLTTVLNSQAMSHQLHDLFSSHLIMQQDV